MAIFEGYERRIEKINAELAKYGINGIDDAKAICDAKGIDVFFHRARHSANRV